MNELITVVGATIGSELVQTVNARELHEFLEVKAKFADWIKDRISQYSFTQDVDFVVIPNFAKDSTAFGGSRKTIDYHITLDMAKELSMVERNSKGKEARQYFIECERSLKDQYSMTMNRMNLLPAQVGEATIDSMMRVASKWNVPPSYAMQVASIEATKQTGMPWDRLLTQAKIMENVPQSDVMLEPTDLGKLFGMSAKEMNIWLYERGLQVKKADSWVPTEEGAQYCQRHAWARGSKSGYNLKWNAAAIEEMMKVAA